MGNKDSKETQCEQESDESDADDSLAENLSIQLVTHEENGDNNEHDTVLGCATHVQSVNCERDNNCKLLVYVYCLSA